MVLEHCFTQPTWSNPARVKAAETRAGNWSSPLPSWALVETARISQGQVKGDTYLPILLILFFRLLCFLLFNLFLPLTLSVTEEEIKATTKNTQSGTSPAWSFWCRNELKNTRDWYVRSILTSKKESQLKIRPCWLQHNVSNIAQYYFLIMLHTEQPQQKDRLHMELAILSHTEQHLEGSSSHNAYNPRHGIRSVKNTNSKWTLHPVSVQTHLSFISIMAFSFLRCWKSANSVITRLWNSSSY